MRLERRSRRAVSAPPSSWWSAGRARPRSELAGARPAQRAERRRGAGRRRSALGFAGRPAARGAGGLHRHPAPVRAQGRGRRACGSSTTTPTTRPSWPPTSRPPASVALRRRPGRRRLPAAPVQPDPAFAAEFGAALGAGRRGRRDGRLRRPRGPDARGHRRDSSRPRCRCRPGEVSFEPSWFGSAASWSPSGRGPATWC